MNKIISLIIVLIFFSPHCFSNSVFTKKEEYVVNKEIPYFINIFSDDYDVRASFDEPQVYLNPQAKIFSKKSDEIKDTNSDDGFFVTVKRSQSVSNLKRQTDKIEFSTNHVYGNWRIKNNVAQETISGLNGYYNSISFEPEYKLNDSFSFFGGLSHSITSNFDQTKFGFKYIPFHLRWLEFEMSVSNYTKNFGSYKQNLNFGANLKI